MVRLGLWSYAFYLLHQTINYAITDRWGNGQGRRGGVLHHDRYGGGGDRAGRGALPRAGGAGPAVVRGPSAALGDRRR
ncbi:hypothetical protein ACW23B_20375 [Streptomyces albidoflavus]